MVCALFMSGKNQHEPNPQQSLVTKTHKWRNTFIYIVKIWIFGPSLKIHTSEDRTTEIGRSQGSGVNSVLTEAKPLLIAKRPNSFNKAYPVYPSPWVNIRSGASQWRALGRNRIESILVLPIYVTLRLLLCCVRFTDFPFIVEWLGQTVLYSHFSPWIEEVVWVAMGFSFSDCAVSSIGQVILKGNIDVIILPKNNQQWANFSASV